MQFVLIKALRLVYELWSTYYFISLIIGNCLNFGISKAKKIDEFSFTVIMFQITQLISRQTKNVLLLKNQSLTKPLSTVNSYLNCKSYKLTSK